MIRKLHLLNLLLITALFSASTVYGQTALPGTLEVEDGDLSQNNAGRTDRNIVGSGNDGTNNIVDNWRKTQDDANEGVGIDGTIIHNVTVAADGDYDFTFTYFKNSNDNTITINSTDATGGTSTTLASFTLIRNDASGTGTATTSSYSTQTVTAVPLTTGINYITFRNAASASLDLDNVIVSATIEASATSLPGTVEVEGGTVAGTAVVGDGNGDTSNVVTTLSGGSSNSVSNNVTVATAGYYNFEFTYFNEAAGAGSATMEVVSPSSTVFSTFSMPVAGTTGAYATVSNEIIFLDEGTYELKFYNDNANAISLDNYVVTSYAPTTALPGTVQVEYGVKSGGNETTGLIGSENNGTNNVRTNNRKNGTNTVITNNVTVSTAGDYDFNFSYYSTSSEDRTLTIKADGATVGTHEMVKNSDDGGVSTSAYGSFTVEDVTLPTGTYDIELEFSDPGGVSIDNYIVSGGPILGADELSAEKNAIHVYPNPSVDGKFKLNTSTSWSVYSVLGEKIIEGEGNQVDLSSLAKGMYILKTDNGIGQSLIYN